MYSWLEQTYNNYLEMRRLNRLSHAVLICGAEGLGVRELSQEIARVSLCSAKGLENCNCHSCAMLKANTHPDFIVVNKGEGSSIGVDQLRSCIEALEETSTNAHGKVVLVEGANYMTTAASNALLKTLEEPPRNSFIILTANNVRSLLPTIISRTMRLQVTIPPMDELNKFLQDLTHTDDDFRLALAVSGMSPLKVKTYIENGLNQKLYEAVKIFADVVMKREQVVSFVNFVDKQIDKETLFGLLYVLLKDIMLYQNGVKIEHLHALGHYPDLLNKLVMVHPDSLNTAMRHIVSLKTVPGMKTSPVNNLQLVVWLNLLVSIK
jgi:DNA polymerase III subunit delta'